MPDDILRTVPWIDAEGETFAYQGGELPDWIQQSVDITVPPPCPTAWDLFGEVFSAFWEKTSPKKVAALEPEMVAFLGFCEGYAEAERRQGTEGCQQSAIDE